MLKALLVLTLAMGSLAHQPVDPVLRASQRFLASLDGAQRKETLLAFDSESRFDFHYVPLARKGVSLGEMNGRQRAAAEDLLRASLSQTGYSKIEQIRQLEVVLRQIENNPRRDPNRYHFLFFGQPHASRPWTWRYEGHHISLTFAFRDGKLVASTPQFLAASPAVSGNGEPLKKERDLGFALLNSLTAEQRKTATISDRAPVDILTTNTRRAAIEGRKGIPFRSLDSAQKDALLALVAAHAEVQSKDESVRRMRLFALEDPDDLVFAWMGPAERNRRHYYRVQGRDILIEYDNTQDDGNHIHTVWRNLKEDFGGDPLEAHHHASHR
jgi:hypothetical protein